MCHPMYKESKFKLPSDDQIFKGIIHLPSPCLQYGMWFYCRFVRPFSNKVQMTPMFEK